MSTRTDTKPDLIVVLSALLRGEASAGDALANNLRVDAFGLSTFGRTDALDLFATHPLLLSAQPHVLASTQAFAVLDETPDGRAIGVFADLADGVVARVWVVAPTATDATVEPAVPLARDDFLSQLRVPCQGEAIDHPGLDDSAWLGVLALGTDALAALNEPPAASSSQAIVMRAFGGAGGAGGIAALYSLRVQEHTAPRRAHRRLALATARLDGAGAMLHSRRALTDPLPEPAAVFFSVQ